MAARLSRVALVALGAGALLGGSSCDDTPAPLPPYGLSPMFPGPDSGEVQDATSGVQDATSASSDVQGGDDMDAEGGSVADAESDGSPEGAAPDASSDAGDAD
jgi:hypothetical protein